MEGPPKVEATRSNRVGRATLLEGWLSGPERWLPYTESPLFYEQSLYLIVARSRMTIFVANHPATHSFRADEKCRGSLLSRMRPDIV